MAGEIINGNGQVFDQDTGAWVGALDLTGRAQRVFSDSGQLLAPVTQAPVSGGSAPPGMRVGKARPRMMLFGNSIARAQRRNGGGGGVNQIFGYGWLWWAQSFLGWPMQFVLTGDEYQVGSQSVCTAADGVGGWSGGTSVEINSVLLEFIGAHSPDVLFLQCQENDPPSISDGVISIAQAAAAYRSLISKAKAAGAIPVWIECLPSTDFQSGTRPLAYAQCVREARAACDEMGAIYIPTLDLYTDFSLSYPGPLNSGAYANNVYTNVHPANTGLVIGQRVADVLDALGWSSYAPSPAALGGQLIHGNGGCSGNTGGVSGGWTGAAPAGATITGSSTGITTATAALTQYGCRQVMDCTFSAAAQAGITTALQVYNPTYGTTGFNVGDLVSAYIDVEFTTAPVGLRTIEMQAVMQGVTQFYVNVVPTGDSAVMYAPVNRRMTIMTPAVKVPAGTTGIRETAKFNTVVGSPVAFACRVYGYGCVNWSF